MPLLHTVTSFGLSEILQKTNIFIRSGTKHFTGTTCSPRLSAATRARRHKPVGRGTKDANTTRAQLAEKRQ
ncbi:hypothetical protein E2C01_060842 [Portunus trituberculatus]|uniref:Uncharacterized protein n=1 Tax=Portunus trituberculatus TaxID=210409 RepID=A0A5B7H2A4_PORTR|nr:hypothetical protein [Portunus trituberculatus]